MHRYLIIDALFIFFRTVSINNREGNCGDGGGSQGTQRKVEETAGGRGSRCGWAFEGPGGRGGSAYLGRYA